MKHEMAPQYPHLGGAFFGTDARQWGWILALGLSFVLLGGITVGMLLWATLASIYFIGILLLIGATAQALQAFAFHGLNNVGTHLLMSALYLVMGVLVLDNPLGTSLALTTLLGTVMIILGLVRSLTALGHRVYRSWGWLFASGLITMALGTLVLLQWLGAGFWIIGMYVGIDLVFHGLAYMGLGMAVREAR